MYTLINEVSENQILSDMGSSADMQRYIEACGVDGLEVIRCGDDERGIITPDMVVGCHLVFYSDWVDYWRGNEPALQYKFGSRETMETMYMAKNREEFIAQFRADMEYAERMGVRYAVFHVSDVSIDEGYSYRWEHSDKAVIDASAELLNLLTDGQGYSFELLLENLWWKGFSMTNPHLTAYMLDAVHYEKKGIMLDTGHLMNANLDLTSQEDGVRYIHRILDAHGELTQYIRGVHLHQSVSGAYVRQALQHIPPHDPDYFHAFAEAYTHILQIDTHQPFTTPAIRSVIDRLEPAYLVHELSVRSRAERIEKTRLQARMLG